MNLKKLQTPNSVTPEHIRLGCLALAGVIEAITIVAGRYYNYWIGTMLVSYLNMLAMLFLGVTILRPMEKEAKRMLLLGGAFFAWPLLLQLYDLRFMTSSGDHIARFQSYTFFCEYVMLLPFACVAQEQDRPRGLMVFGSLFAAGSAVLGWGLMRFALGQVPDPIPEVYVWTDGRLNAIWNGNLTAAILLVGIGFCTILAMLTRRWWLRCLLGLAAVMEYLVLCLTDCQGVIVMLSVLAGGVGFFCIFRNDHRTWKRAVLALTAALLLFVGAYKLSGTVYGIHYDAYLNHPEWYQNSELPGKQEAAQAQQPAEEAEDKSDVRAGQIERYHEYRGSVRHLLNFGGRVAIWEASVRGIQDDPGVLISGSRDIPNLITSHMNRGYYHSHNSWLQPLLVLGVVGLGFALYFTYLALKTGILLMFFRETSFYQKFTAMLMLSFMGTQISEVFLFCAEWPINFLNMAFLICLGYMVYWEKHTEKISYRKKS